MKGRFLAAAVLGVTVLALQGAPVGAAGQTPAPRPADDGARVRALVERIAAAIRANDRAAYLGLVAPSADRARAQDFLAFEMRPGVTRAVVIERDRQHLVGTLPGYGHRLLVDAFIEYADRARVATWQVDVKKIDDVEWRVADQERLSTVENLYRLTVNPTRQFRARNFTIASEDLTLTVVDGKVFTVDTDQGTTGLVVTGHGEMRFAPAPETEQGQVRIFAGDTRIASRFDAAFVRVGDLRLHADFEQLEAEPVDPRELRRAQEVFRGESAKSYVLDLGDLTSDTWSLVPAAGDFLAEIRTRRFDTLTYARSRSEPEDISVFNRRRQRNISVYASAERLAARGPFYNEDDLAPFDVIRYDIDLAATPTPERQWLQGVTRMRLRVRGGAITQVGLRLADSLEVQSVVSEEYGRLFHLRVRNQNTVLVNLPITLLRDAELNLTVAYAGRLAPQPPERESLTLQGPQREDRSGFREIDVIAPTGERSYLYSNRSYWYPQAQITDYATARVRISVPLNLGVVATGQMTAESPLVVPGRDGGAARKQYEFVADRPVRYLAFIVSRFVRAERMAVNLDRSSPVLLAAARPAPAQAQATRAGTLILTVEANPLQVARGRELAQDAAEIARFYHSLIGESPYPSFTLALIEHLQPGGHSPAYFAALNQPLPNTPLRWTNDPVNFEGFPEFFLAHEMAHQWWGQAVGWRNYHEQWLSEGFAQYFAALYAERRHGDEVFGELMGQLREWAIERSDQGPVYLGYRLGHIRNQPPVFRALVYNKGAAVLHMLRRLIGDQAFFKGLRRFYDAARFTKVGTEDLRAAMEFESGWMLERFFTRWIYAASLPRVTFRSTVEAVGGGHEAVLHFTQEGDIFDLPVTVALQYADRRLQRVTVPVFDRTAEMRVPLDGILRDVSIATDDGTVAEIRENQ